MSDTALVAEFREGKGKGVARKLRAAGRIPGVLYGRGKPSVPVSLDPDALEKVLKSSESGMNTLIDLTVQGRDDLGESVVMVRELQRSPVFGEFLHADLFEIDLQQRIEVEVPIHLEGKAKGVELGGILDHALRELEVECLPRAIPDELRVDVSDLDIGDSLHVRDIALPEGVELRSDPDLSVVSVVAPVKEEEPVAAEGEAVAEGEAAAAPAEGDAAADAAKSAESEEKSGD